MDTGRDFPSGVLIMWLSGMDQRIFWDMTKGANDMKITGTKAYVDIEWEGRTLRFWGDMCVNGFAALADTAEWLPPFESETVSDETRSAIMAAVRKDHRHGALKIKFLDKNGKRIRR